MRRRLHWQPAASSGLTLSARRASGRVWMLSAAAMVRRRRDRVDVAHAETARRTSATPISAGSHDLGRRRRPGRRARRRPLGRGRRVREILARPLLPVGHGDGALQRERRHVYRIRPPPTYYEDWSCRPSRVELARRSGPSCSRTWHARLGRLYVLVDVPDGRRAGPSSTPGRSTSVVVLTASRRARSASTSVPPSAGRARAEVVSPLGDRSRGAGDARAPGRAGSPPAATSENDSEDSKDAPDTVNWVGCNAGAR